MDIVAGRDRIWGKSRLYGYKEGREPIVLHREGDEFRVNDKFRDNLSENGYVIIARGGRRFDSLLSRIPSEGRKHISPCGGDISTSQMWHIALSWHNLYLSTMNIYIPVGIATWRVSTGCFQRLVPELSSLSTQIIRGLLQICSVINGRY